MNIIKRIFNLITGLLTGIVKAFESKHPQTVFDNALQKRRKKLSDLVDAIANFKVAVDESKERLQAQIVKLQETESMLRDAVVMKDEARGPQLHAKAKQLAKIIEAESTQLEENEKALQDAQLQLKETKLDLERFETEGRRKIAEGELETTKIELIEKWDDPRNSPEEQALASIHEHYRAQKARQEILQNLHDENRQTAEMQNRAHLADFRQLCREQDGAELVERNDREEVFVSS